MKDDRVYLAYILDCIGRIEQYVADGRESFMTSTLIQDAVNRNLQVLAQSSQRISDDIKTAHPGIEWRALVAFRNILVHDYLGINLDQVWELFEPELATLKQEIEAVMQGLDDSS